MIRRLLSIAAASALGVLALAPSPAWAAPGATIEKVTTNDSDIRVVVSLDDVGDETVDTDTVDLDIEGREISASTETLSDVGEFRQVALLVLDVSDSMAGDRLVAAKQSALDLVAAIPPEVEVGLVTFASTAQLAVEPTTDRSVVGDAIETLQTQPKTVLYDAIDLAANELRGVDFGSAIVLSDGSDRGSIVSLDSAVKAAEKSEAVFDVVSFGTSTSQLTALDAIATASEGSVTTAADAAELSAAFDQSAETLNNQYLVAGAVPTEFAGKSATVTVAITVGDTRVSDSAFVQLAEVAPDIDPADVRPVAVPEPGPLVVIADNLIWFALGGIFLALLIVLYFAISSATDREASGTGGVKRRLSIYTLGGGQPVKEQETTVLGDTQVARSAVEFAGRVVAKRDLENLVGTRLDAAAVPLKPAEWLLIHIGVTILAGLLFLLVFGGRLFPALFGMVLGFLIPSIYLSIKESRRIKAFGAALPDTLQLVAGSLSAGYSMPQAIDTVVREGSAPISTEFNRALVEARLGVPLEDALDGIATRMQSVDFAWVVMAIRIQREVGGNLAEVLNTVAATLRERERLRRQVLVLSAEGRLSAWILGGLPVVFACYLVLVRPQYLSPLVSTFFGWLLIGLALTLLTVGSLWLRKVVKVEV